jgi:hypothetical protein
MENISVLMYEFAANIADISGSCNGLLKNVNNFLFDL